MRSDFVYFFLGVALGASVQLVKVWWLFYYGLPDDEE